MATVKVRVAVAVDREGKWNACGWESASPDDMMSIACDTVGSGEARYWIIAEVDVPGEPELPAAVEPA